MEGRTPTIENNEMYSKEEFIKKFNNFHLVFAVRDPEYLPDIKEFLQINYPVEFGEFKEKFQKTGNLPTKTVVANNIDALFRMYLVLKQDGKFSNKALGLIYW